MSGAKSNILFAFETRKEWEDLWWILAENEIVKYNEIKKLEVVQFYRFLERWKIAMKNKTKKN